MGVHGLWELLAPVGRRVSVEALGGRKLAIGWLCLSLLAFCVWSLMIVSSLLLSNRLMEISFPGILKLLDDEGSFFSIALFSYHEPKTLVE